MRRTAGRNVGLIERMPMDIERMRNGPGGWLKNNGMELWNQSDSNILDRHTGRRQGYDDPRGYGGEPIHRENWKNAGGQPYSYSADRAVTYARMQGPGNKGYKQNVAFKDVSMAPQDGGRSGPRERFAYTHPMPTSRYSPYDILLIYRNEQLRVSDPNGYLMKLHKQREPPNYKEYTVKDYRALKRDIRLGGLGPDPELVHERQEKAQRQREYAKAIMQQNKKSMKRPEKPWTPPNEKPQGQEIPDEELYAKNISRPPYKIRELHARIYGTNSRLKDDLQVRDGAKTYMVDEIAKLEELAERHRQEKEEIDRLRSGQAP
ncbi:hypothetical protein BSL78_22498 [Apostichopus japonicus]|uniref:Enkurin domain-containing protein n=1 Tax=Stichopus japonicus TaxID=307972 RepID=A0A2G8JY79_STIJA|nr:hypothetical protein BSL78_22498 [Apostichopus japonicus]